jgi:hypothetical protein
MLPVNACSVLCGTLHIIHHAEIGTDNNQSLKHLIKLILIKII